MCLIIYKPKAKTKIDPSIIKRAEVKNPDGFGITFLDDGETIKTLDYDLAWKLIHEKRPLVAHYRFATVGFIDRSNCHPFPTGSGKLLVYSNGTVSGLGSEETTDTQAVAEILTRVPRKYHHEILSMTETRFAIVDVRDGSVNLHGNWHKRKGLWYSKDNCFHAPKKVIGFGPYAGGHSTPNTMQNGYIDPAFNENHYVTSEPDFDSWQDYLDAEEMETRADYTDPEDDYETWLPGDLLAVYGTLKSNHGNHRFHLSGAKYEGHGHTLDRYAMTVDGIPFVYSESINAPGANQITVELYSVEDATERASIDSLEGHPHWYRRELVDVVTSDGDVVSAWIYMIPDAVPEPTKSNPWVAEY